MFMYEYMGTRIDMVMCSSPVCLEFNKFFYSLMDLTWTQFDIAVPTLQDTWFLRNVGIQQMHFASPQDPFTQLLRGSAGRSVLAKPLSYRSRMCIVALSDFWTQGISKSPALWHKTIVFLSECLTNWTYFLRAGSHITEFFNASFPCKWWTLFIWAGPGLQKVAAIKSAVLMLLCLHEVLQVPALVSKFKANSSITTRYFLFHSNP